MSFMNVLQIFVNKNIKKMTLNNFEELNYENHREKCRICLLKVESGPQKIQITKQIQQCFLNVSGIEVCLKKIKK